MNSRAAGLMLSFVFSTVGCGGNNAAKKGYVGLFGDKAVAVFDTATQKVLTTIPVTAPDGLVITPDGKKVYVSSADSGKVDVIDTATDTLLSSITVGTMPQGLSMAPDGARVVCAVQGDGKVAVIDTTTDAVVSEPAVGKPHSSGISPDSKVAYVGSQTTGATELAVLDIAAGTFGQTLAVDKAPRALSDSPWGKIYFSVVGSDALEVLDPTSGQPAAPITTGGSPHDTRPTVDGKVQLVVSQTAGDLEFIDPNSAAVTDKVPTGKMPHWIALSSDGKLAYVTNEGANNLVAVDLTAKAVVQTIAIGNAPRKIAVQP